MIRLNVIAEGQTEETFVNRVLAPHLADFDVFATVHCITTSRRYGRLHRGGVLNYLKVRNDLERWMKQDRNAEARFTTLIDLYGLPQSFPGYSQSRHLQDVYEIVELIEGEVAKDLGDRRFIPYIQLHEFEALLLVDPRRFEDIFINRPQAIESLVALSSTFESPEEIDDGVKTAPSKRIIREIPEYGDRKASAGPLIAEKIGIPALRDKCPHFDSWLERLERLG